MTRAPKIVFFNQTALYGGAERSLYDIVMHYPGPSTTALLGPGPLATDLAMAGKSICVLPSGLTISARAGPRVLLTSAWKTLTTALRFARLARDHDIVYANSMRAVVVAVLSRPVHRRKIIWHLRSLMIREQFSPFLLRFTHWIVNWGVNLVIANSKATSRAYASSGGSLVPTVIYNGFEPQNYFPDHRPALRTWLTDRFGLDPAKPILGIIGRISPWKGHDVVFDALGRNPNWQLLVIGEALFESDGFRSAFNARRAALQASGNIVFTGHRNDIPRLLGGLDIAIHASTLPEPFGRVVVEAMLAGTPIIATDAGGVPEIIDHATTGWLYEQGSSAQLESTIHSVLANPKLTTIVTHRARAHAIKRFALSHSLPQIFAAIAMLEAEPKDQHHADPLQTS